MPSGEDIEKTNCSAAGDAVWVGKDVDVANGVTVDVNINVGIGVSVDTGAITVEQAPNIITLTRTMMIT